MTLSGVIALILLFFTEFDSFAGRLCHSVFYQFQSSTFGQIKCTLQRDISAIPEHLVKNCDESWMDCVHEDCGRLISGGSDAEKCSHGLMDKSCSRL